MSSRYRRGGQLLRSSARPQGQRQGNRIFYVVAEGEATEYDYLRHLNRIYGPDHRFVIQTHNQRRGLSASQVVDTASGAFEKLGPDGIEVWALFDHDGQRDIDQVCSRAKRQGIQPALSHPSFELWLLMHFQDFSPAAQNGSNNVIMEKLRAAHPAFADYREGSKHIDERRFEALSQADGIHKAAERARRLSATFTTEVPNRQDPSTGLYQLIESLGIVTPSQQAVDDVKSDIVADTVPDRDQDEPSSAASAIPEAKD